MFKLILENNDHIIYDIINNVMYNSKNQKINFDYEENEEKSIMNTLIRIHLGADCNFRCDYCIQDDSMGMSSCVDLNDYTNENITKISKRLLELFPDGRNYQFFGGEPLVYLKEMKLFLELLSVNDKNEFSIITNGSLITDEVADLFIKHNFTVVLSHDGHGQFHRGVDPLIVRKEQILKLHDNLDVLVFAPTITNDNYNIEELLQWFEHTTGRKDMGIFGYTPVIPSNENAFKLGIDKENLKDFSEQLTNHILSTSVKETNTIQRITNSIDEFCKNVKYGNKPSLKFGCFNSPHGPTILLDMKGNLIECSTSNVPFGPNIFDDNFEEIKHTPNKLKKQHIKKTKCEQCVVYPVCFGVCPLVNEKYIDGYCEVLYHKNFAILNAIIASFTGNKIIKVEEINND